MCPYIIVFIIIRAFHLFQFFLICLCSFDDAVVFVAARWSSSARYIFISERNRDCTLTSACTRFPLEIGIHITMYSVRERTELIQTESGERNGM